jgi:hypothetical protein
VEDMGVLDRCGTAGHAQMCGLGRGLATRLADDGVKELIDGLCGAVGGAIRCGRSHDGGVNGMGVFVSFVNRWQGSSCRKSRQL